MITMPAPLSLPLTDTEQQQMQSYLDRHPLPYVRERAAALFHRRVINAKSHLHQLAARFFLIEAKIFSP